MSDQKRKMPTVFQTGFNLLFILIEVAIYIFIVAIVPWGFGMFALSGYDVVMQFPLYIRSWVIGIFFIGGFVMSMVGLVGLSLAGRDSLKKSIKRIQVGRK